jgi:bacterioferritin-associated ferredoxin
VYVCLCNALTEARIMKAADDGARRPGEVYAACGGRAQCGTCTSTVLCMLRKLAPQTDTLPDMAGAD